MNMIQGKTPRSSWNTSGSLIHTSENISNTRYIGSELIIYKLAEIGAKL